MESGVSIKEEYSIQTQSGVDGGYAWVVLFASFFVRSDQKNRGFQKNDYIYLGNK